MSKKIHQVSLTDQEHHELTGYLHKGVHAARILNRVRVLLLADAGQEGGRRKGDEAKKIIKSMYKLDSPFVRYALPSSYCVHYPRLAHSKPPRYLQHTIAKLSYGPIAK